MERNGIVKMGVKNRYQRGLNIALQPSALAYAARSIIARCGAGAGIAWRIGVARCASWHNDVNSGAT
jgi:hypothetical protein